MKVFVQVRGYRKYVGAKRCGRNLDDEVVRATFVVSSLPKLVFGARRGEGDGRGRTPKSRVYLSANLPFRCCLTAIPFCDHGHLGARKQGNDVASNGRTSYGRGKLRLAAIFGWPGRNPYDPRSSGERYRGITLRIVYIT